MPRHAMPCHPHATLMPPCPCRSGLTFLIWQVSYDHTLSGTVKHDWLPRPGRGGGGAHREITLQRPLTFSISYMSSINDAMPCHSMPCHATLMPLWCHSDATLSSMAVTFLTWQVSYDHTLSVAVKHDWLTTSPPHPRPGERGGAGGGRPPMKKVLGGGGL